MACLDTKPLQTVMDIECYINYFLVKFLRVIDDKIFTFEMTKDFPLDIKGIKAILKEYEIVDFNGDHYDVLMLRLALTGATNKELKVASDLLIKKDPVTKKTMSPWKFEKQYNLPELKIKSHIDMIELIKGELSLKMYGGRINCIKMQDLPFPEHTVLTEQEMDEVDTYCGNDLILTKGVFLEIWERIEIRRVMSKRYGIDLMSKSDAQMAEAVFTSEIEKLSKRKVEKSSIYKGVIYYESPKFIKFENPKLNEVLDIVTTKPFTIGTDGKPVSPKEYAKFQIKIGSSTYTMGRGGLHSTEKAAFHLEDDKYSIWDWDVASYYPSVILNCGLYPKALGKEFLQLYQSIVTERLEAKHNKDKVKADVLKILINGSFGKLGQLYSTLYAPNLMLQVTITGQLAILMLIDELEFAGIPVISGNTDGIVIKCPKAKEALMHEIINEWMEQTEFELEATRYVGIYSRDINNYLAFKQNGEVKRKGVFNIPSIDDKNPENEICTLAMIAYLKHGTPFEDTIRNCKDITKFVTIRNVAGGAEKDGKYLGKAIRYYHAEGERGKITYCNNGNLVPLTEGAKPLMDISVLFPTDIDYQWYLNATRNIFGK